MHFIDVSYFAFLVLALAAVGQPRLHEGRSTPKAS